MAGLRIRGLQVRILLGALGGFSLGPLEGLRCEHGSGIGQAEEDDRGASRDVDGGGVMASQAVFDGLAQGNGSNRSRGKGEQGTASGAGSCEASAGEKRHPLRIGITGKWS